MWDEDGRNTDIASLEERSAALDKQGLKLEKLLASGAFAEVYKVSPSRSADTHIAAKVYYELEWEARIRHARREFNTILELKHANVLEVFELVIDDDIIFATMELMGGGELLDHIVAGTGLALPLGRSVLEDVCRGLMFLHEERGIVHLDIKPENILLSSTGRAKLADFDAALPEGTHVYVVRGTAECHPPEYLPGNKEGYTIRRQADNWALGLVVYEVLVGAYPWDSPSKIDPGYANFRSAAHATAPWKQFPDQLMQLFEGVFNDDVSSRAEAVDVLAYVVSSFETDYAAIHTLDTNPKTVPAEDCNDEDIIIPETESPDRSPKLQQLISTAWSHPLNISEKWTVLATPREFGNHDRYVLVCIQPQEHQRFGRIVCEERYSRLLALHRMCTGFHPKETPRCFPKKKIFRNRQSEFLQERASAIADYFEQAFAIPECLRFYIGTAEFHVIKGDLEDPFYSKLESLAIQDDKHPMIVHVSDGSDPEKSDSDSLFSIQSVHNIDGVYIAPIDVQAYRDSQSYITNPSDLPEWVLKCGKNRFTDVLPSWKTRVKINNDTIADSPSSYINANFISVPGDTGPTFIAAQSPMSNTIQDFWQMVFVHNVSAIVMLTNLSENGVECCAEYWPSSRPGATQGNGKFKVTSCTVDAGAKFTITRLKLIDVASGDERSVTHFWYTDWTSSATPTSEDGRADPDALLQMIEKVRLETNKKALQPIVVHCDSGIGRTGTYLLINFAINMLHMKMSIDLIHLLDTLRKCRMSLVTQVAQYKFAWQAVVTVARKTLRGQRSQSIYSLDSRLSHRVSTCLRRDSLMHDRSYEMSRIGPDTLFQLRPDAKPVVIFTEDETPTHPKVVTKKKKRRQLDTFTSDDIGTRVIVSGYNCLGRLRFVGLHYVHQTPRVGIELDAPIGNNNGVVSGFKYFECNDAHGVLCTPAKVTKVHGSAAKITKPKVSAEDVGTTVCVSSVGLGKLAHYQNIASDSDGSSNIICGVLLSQPVGNSDGTFRGISHFKCKPKHAVFVAPQKLLRLSPNKNDIGRLVTIRGYDSVGILRFFGMHHEKSSLRCGVELDHPIGNNDGTIQGHEYFVCAPGHGVLCNPAKVRLYHRRLDRLEQNLKQTKDKGESLV